MYDPEQPIYDEEVVSSIKVHIGIDEHPKSWLHTIYYALQITLVDFTPFIWSASYVAIAGLPETVIPVMITACFIAMGIGTLMQTTIGNRLPIVQGPSGALVASMGNVTKFYGMPAMWGSVIVGGLIEALIGATRVMSRIRKFLPPTVLGAVVASIGFVAAKLAITWTFSRPEPAFLILALIAFLLALFLKFKCKGVLSQGFMLLSVVAVGVIGGSVLKVMDWQSVADAPWIALPKLFPFKDFEGVGNGQAIAVIGAAVLGGFTGYIGSMFESIGDYAATSAACNVTFKVKHIDRGIMSEGLACAIGGLFGALPTTSYSQNIGVVAATGVASRRVTRVAAVFFLLYGLCPKLGTFLAAIPRPVIGAVFLITASMIMFSGLDLIASAERTQRNTMIAGTTLGASVMIPYFVTTGGAAWAKTLPAFLNMFVNSNIFIAVVFGVVLNLLLNHLFKEKVKTPSGSEAASEKAESQESQESGG